MSARRTTTLAQVLRQGHLRVALVALITVGAVLTLASALTIQVTLQRNLELVGRSIAYSVEAAVTFRDATAAEELLRAVADRENLAATRIELANGATLASFERAERDAAGALALALRRLLPLHAQVPMPLAGKPTAVVHVHGDSMLFLVWIGWAISGILAAMVLTGVAITLVSRRLERIIVDPLRALAAHTRAVRDDAAFSRLAPSAIVREIDELGADFNALLSEVQAREAELVRRHEALQLDHADLHFSARHDALTGVANRAFFEQRLQEAIERAGREHLGLGVLFIDADRFKEINDVHGHAAGDTVLIAVAKRLRAAVRESDLVGRLGGDEFAVLIDPLRSLDLAWRVAEKIGVAVAQPITLGEGQHITPSVSVGVASYPESGASAEALLVEADAAMYLIKRGRSGKPPDAIVPSNTPPAPA